MRRLMPHHIEEGLAGGEDLSRLCGTLELRGVATKRLELCVKGLGDVRDEGRFDLVLAEGDRVEDLVWAMGRCARVELGEPSQEARIA
ncbi:MAG: hypothetical protein ACKOFO_04370, partial [Gemmatimonadota bacterium]